MHRPTHSALFLLYLVAFLPASLRAGSPEARDSSPTAAPTEAAVVTPENLLESERFWPYRVMTTERWQPEGRDEPLRNKEIGVLIRVEPSGLPRVDFGRLGKYDVPIEKTDLLERANRIRRGELEKPFPNFVQAIRTRMLDPAFDPPRPLQVEYVDDRAGFLCVFAAPSSFAEMAGVLASLRDRHGVQTILFPQGAHPDAGIAEQLRSLGWTVPFLADYLAEPYTRTLLPRDTEIPHVLLHTAEGRVLFQSPWSAGVTPSLTKAWDDGFSTSAATVAVGDRSTQ